VDTDFFFSAFLRNLAFFKLLANPNNFEEAGNLEHRYGLALGGGVA
jgi:hypothetical protein